MTFTRDDVIAAVQRVFAQSDAMAALTLLDHYGIEPHERERERVQLAIIELSNGDDAALPYLLKCAKRDYRDVLQWQASGPLSPEHGLQAQRAVSAALERLRKK